MGNIVFVGGKKIKFERFKNLEALNAKAARKFNPIGNAELTATLELLVRIEDRTLIDSYYSKARVKFDENSVQEIDLRGLVEGLDCSETGISTQEYGNQWSKNAVTAILEMPSVVTSREVNYLINLNHEDFGKINLGEMISFPIDCKLVGN